MQVSFLSEPLANMWFNSVQCRHQCNQLRSVQLLQLRRPQLGCNERHGDTGDHPRHTQSDLYRWNKAAFGHAEQLVFPSLHGSSRGNVGHCSFPEHQQRFHLDLGCREASPDIFVWMFSLWYVLGHICDMLCPFCLYCGIELLMSILQDIQGCISAEQICKIKYLHFQCFLLR